MAIIRWDPFRDLVTLRDKMNRLFEETFSSRSEERDIVYSTWTPSVDIFETEHDLVISAELPGIDEKDIDIKIEDHTIIIKGERKFEKETTEENYHRIERAYGSFYRSFSLPHYIDQENIKAEYENGILKIVMLKKLESKPRTVKVLKPKKQVKTEKKTKK
jgi:HSP20 family protein